MGLIEMILAAIVMVINHRFFTSGFKGLFRGAPNMDTLVALGSAASFCYSAVILFLMNNAEKKGDTAAVSDYMNDLYFESAAMILTLITVGKLLEAYSKGKTTNALKGLMKLAPKTAVVIRDNEEKTVSIEEVAVGDIFVVRSGESVPVDGVIIEGDCAVNESALTGESIPVDKTAGDKISAATINQSGFVKCRAERVGRDTTLSQIINMVSEAASTKAPVAKIADKVSGIFVPVVIGIALLTFAVWMITGSAVGFTMARAISVLVISCPCALGLATPVAIMVGNGVGAKSGILFKTAVSLEETGKADVVVLDKTGTITKGDPSVTDIFVDSGVDEETFVRMCCSIEARSEHPIAKAIVAYGSDRLHLAASDYYEVSEFKTHPGNGISGSVMYQQFFCGNTDFIQKYASIDPKFTAKAEEFANDGKTPVFFASAGNVIGMMAVADTIKDDCTEAVSRLKEMGMRVIMLTGDNRRTAEAIGRMAGVDEVIADVLPDGKEQIIRELRESGSKVIMVGDGINDAPALTRADIGIAIGAGTDIAIDAADVVLMKSDMMDVASAVKLSRATLKNIHENLFWAFIYNIIGIPLAAGVYYPIFGWKLSPMFGAAAMSLSSFCVVTNALRLNLVKLFDKKN
ncbi:MAG TPA: Cu2+-exporting ATPase, partial [Lachnospiraceae bacterium]|nr:Cu2+-exporting ATPase [Lachnospiraceae bacterium]